MVGLMWQAHLLCLGDLFLELVSCWHQKGGDLLLPRDVDFSTSTVLLAIKEPKTRGTGAKHQAAKLDVPDLIEVVDFAYKDLSENESLWPFSGQTLRTRFRHLLTALKATNDPSWELASS